MRGERGPDVGDYVVNCDVDCHGGGDNYQHRQEKPQAEHEDVVAEVRLKFPRWSTAEGLKVLDYQLKVGNKILSQTVFPLKFSGN